MPIVTIIREDIEFAEKREAEVLASGVLKRENYTGLSAPRRYFYGYLGERLVVRWMRDSGIDAVHRVNTGGRSQKAEIMVGNTKVEIKTQASPYCEDFRFPASPRQNVDAKFAVAVHRLDYRNQRADIVGAITGADANALPTKIYQGYDIVTRYCPYRLMPISCDELLVALDDWQ